MGTDFLYFFQKFRNICFQIYGLGQGWGTYLLSWIAWIVDYCWWDTNNNWFILRFYLILQWAMEA